MLIRLLRVHARPHLARIGLLVLLQLAQTAAAVALPTLMAVIVDRAVAADGAGTILRAGGAMLGLTGLQVCCAAGAVLLGSRVAAAVGHDLRAAVFGHVQLLSTQALGRFGTASLVTRTTNDVQQVQSLVRLGLIVSVAAPLTVACGVAMAFVQDRRLTALLVLVVPVLALPTALAVRRLRPIMRRNQAALDETSRVLREQIGGQRVVRAFSREGHEQHRFAQRNGEVLALSLRMGRVMALMSPMAGLVLNGAGIAVLWIGSRQIASGDVMAGALAAFLGYLSQILSAVSLTAYLFVVLPRAQVSAERIWEVLDTESSLAPPARLVRTPPRGGRLELKDVDFRFPQAHDPILTGIRLIAGPGETVGVIGPTGSGKSTLFDLMLRLHDATSGVILIDGVDVREIDSAALARTISVVPQRPYLFSGTIASNLRHGRPQATEKELWQALETAQAREFVARLPEGLDAPVSHGGGNLSGGQRQRLTIARALLADPAVLLLDAHDSALDRATAANLRAALTHVNDARTVILASQRVDAVREADRIVVLEDGRVVGTGSHADLLTGNETYRGLARAQQGDESTPREPAIRGTALARLTPHLGDTR